MANIQSFVAEFSNEFKNGVSAVEDFVVRDMSSWEEPVKTPEQLDHEELVCKLYSTMDAYVWAKEFCRINPSMDMGTMIGWFANAMGVAEDITRRKSDEITQSISDITEVQGQDGNWDCDPYMNGMFNGLELALSICEKREPNYRIIPQPKVARAKPEHSVKLDMSVGKRRP